MELDTIWFKHWDIDDSMKKKLYRRSLVRVLSRRFLGRTLRQLDEDWGAEAIIAFEIRVHWLVQAGGIRTREPRWIERMRP